MRRDEEKLVYCNACWRYHPVYLQGCVPTEPVVYNLDATERETERRKLISKAIIENTKSF